MGTGGDVQGKREPGPVSSATDTPGHRGDDNLADGYGRSSESKSGPGSRSESEFGFTAHHGQPESDAELRRNCCSALARKCLSSEQTKNVGGAWPLPAGGFDGLVGGFNAAGRRKQHSQSNPRNGCCGDGAIEPAPTARRPCLAAPLDARSSSPSGVSYRKAVIAAAYAGPFKTECFSPARSMPANYDDLESRSRNLGTVQVSRGHSAAGCSAAKILESPFVPTNVPGS